MLQWRATWQSQTSAGRTPGRAEIATAPSRLGASR
jgi:hypothetical protein